MTKREFQKRAETVLLTVSGAIAEAEQLRDEAQDVHDERSDAWQEGDKGVEWCEGIAALEDLITELESAKDNLSGADFFA